MDFSQRIWLKSDFSGKTLDLDDNDFCFYCKVIHPHDFNIYAFNGDRSLYTNSDLKDSLTLRQILFDIINFILK